MVNAIEPVRAGCLLAVRLLDQLSPLQRARLGLALAAFVVLLVGLVAFIVMSGRMARRIARKKLPEPRDLTDAWARKPLERETVGDVLPDDAAGDDA